MTVWLIDLDSFVRSNTYTTELGGKCVVAGSRFKGRAFSASAGGTAALVIRVLENRARDMGQGKNRPETGDRGPSETK